MSRRNPANPNGPSQPDPSAPESRTSPVGLGLLAAILLFSLLLGAAAVAEFRHSPFNNLPVLDEQSYVDWGREIAAGEVLGAKVFYQDPLYPYFLGLVFRLAGPRLLLVRLLQVLMGTISVGLVFLAAKRLLGEPTGLLAALLLALTGPLYFFELLLLKASLVILLSSASILLGVRAAERPDAKADWIGLGLTLGLLCLLRGNFLALIPPLLVWAALDAAGSMRDRLRRAVLLAAGAALVILPVTARNYAVGGELVLTTSQGGANFYIGNNPTAPGYYGVIPFVRPEPRYEAADFQAEAQRRAGRRLTPSQVSGFWFRQGFAWIAANPGDACLLYLHKARLLIHQFEIPDNYSFTLTRDYFAPALKLPFLGIGLLWGPALVGAAWLWRRDRRSRYPLLFALLYAGAIVPFFIVDRYRSPLLAPLALFAACFLTLAARKWRDRERTSLPTAAAVIFVALLLGLLPTPESLSSMPVAAYNIGNAYYDTGRPAEALRWYERTLAVLPDHAGARANRAAALKWLEEERGQTRP